MTEAKEHIVKSLQISFIGEESLQKKLWKVFISPSNSFLLLSFVNFLWIATVHLDNSCSLPKWERLWYNRPIGKESCYIICSSSVASSNSGISKPLIVSNPLAVSTPQISYLLLYNILLPINCYTGNITTKCYGKSMSDNRDLTETFHQKVSSLPISIASDSRYF